MPENGFPTGFSKELVLRTWAVICLLPFFTCMRGIPYDSTEKVNFFGGIKRVKYPHRGREYNVYKRSNLVAHNIAVFANAN